jgi:hypothetical protein
MCRNALCLNRAFLFFLDFFPASSSFRLISFSSLYRDLFTYHLFIQFVLFCFEKQLLRRHSKGKDHQGGDSKMDSEDDDDAALWREAVDTFRQALRVQAPETLPAPLLAYLNGSAFGERCAAVLDSDAAAVKLPASELSGEWCDMRERMIDASIEGL